MGEEGGQEEAQEGEGDCVKTATSQTYKIHFSPMLTDLGPQGRAGGTKILTPKQKTTLYRKLGLTKREKSRTVIRSKIILRNQNNGNCRIDNNVTIYHYDPKSEILNIHVYDSRYSDTPLIVSVCAAWRGRGDGASTPGWRCGAAPLLVRHKNFWFEASLTRG
jgi:hypothetical protein